MHKCRILVVYLSNIGHTVDMYVARASWPFSSGKIYQSIFLRQSYRDGDHVRKRDIANA